MKQPIQPLVRDDQGVLRFQSNAIVRFLLDNGNHDLTALATMPFSDDDREQFAQLLGCSVSGYHDLSYVTDWSHSEDEILQASRRARVRKAHPTSHGKGCWIRLRPVYSALMSNDKFKTPDSVENVNLELRRQVATVTLLEWFAAVVTSAMMTTILKRLGLLAEGGWLPGMGDINTMAALTNRPVTSLERITGKGARLKQHVGRQSFYSMSDFAQTGEEDDADSPPNDAPAMRKKK